MPDEQPRVRPIARYAPDSESDLDAVACVSGDHLLVYVTGVVESRREVLALEILPLPNGVDAGATALSANDEVTDRLKAALEVVRSTERRSVVTTDMLRRMPVGPALEYRTEAARGALVTRTRRLIEQVADAEQPADRVDAQSTPYLADAAAYASAVRERISPAGLIAEARNISTNSANSRIARGRTFGLLTSSGKAIAAGELTPKAHALSNQLGIDLAL